MDLAEIPGVGGVRARLLYQAGLTTVELVVRAGEEGVRRVLAKQAATRGRSSRQMQRIHKQKAADILSEAKAILRRQVEDSVAAGQSQQAAAGLAALLGSPGKAGPGPAAESAGEEEEMEEEGPGSDDEVRRRESCIQRQLSGWGWLF